MSQRFGFWKDCWIYTNKTERANMKFVLSELKKHKSICLSMLQRKKGKGSKDSIRNALLYLLVARVIKVEQHREVRVYTFNKAWLVKLKKMTTPFKLDPSKRQPASEVAPTQTRELEKHG